MHPLPPGKKLNWHGMRSVPSRSTTSNACSPISAKFTDIDRIETLRRQMNAPPTAWEKTELARHAQRPQSLDYIERVFTDFSEIHGDRSHRDPEAADECTPYRLGKN